MSHDGSVDVVVIGGGAAGTFAALGARGALAEDGATTAPPGDAPAVLLLDGEDRPGRKILVSGGGRCNVTNTDVNPGDFRTGAPRIVRQVLRAFPPAAVRRFLADHGVPTVVEALGKVFPEAPLRARDVLEAIDTAVTAAGARREHGHAVTDVRRDGDEWLVQRDGAAPIRARRVVVATGGRSVPATGSRGFGLDLAGRLGLPLAAPLPHLAPLLARQGAALAGVTLPAIARVVVGDREVDRAAGSLLFTHRGATGPAALDVSGAVEAALATGDPVRVELDLWTLADPDGPFATHLDAPKLPGTCLAAPPAATSPGELDHALRATADGNPRAGASALHAGRLPRRVSEHLVDGLAGPLGQLSRDDRRAVARRTAALDLGVTGTAGYAKAEVTAGGVELGALDRRTLESRDQPGLHWCGEVCDATGRLGGFNFAWAWASGLVAGRGAADALRVG